MAGPGTDALARSVQPSPLEIRECSLWLTECCRRQGVPDGPTGKLELCLNEVLANLIDHGGADACGAPVEVTLEVADGGDRRRATLTISDAGEAFDPLSVSCRPRPRTLQEAEPGGLGLVLVRRFMDERSYERSGDRNVLKLGIHWSKGP
jgi:anti-sigma regulatory factor (Ser/Thr protein kinase)